LKAGKWKLRFYTPIPPPLAALKIMESNEIESTGSSDKGMSAKIDSISPMQEKGRL